MPNRYLRERAMSKRDERRGSHVRGHYRDQHMGRGGSDYGSRGHSDYGRDYSDYTRRSDQSRGNDYRRAERYTDPRNVMSRHDMMDSRRDYRDYNDYRRDYNDYNDYNDYRRDYNDYNDYNDYRRDYNDYGDYDYVMEDENYKKDLKEWIQKLKKQDKFGLKEMDIIEKGKQMGVKFDKYNEDEFILAYYIMTNMFPNIGNDPHMYLAMAKSFMEFKEMAIEPSEALCIYLYKIMKGE